MLDLQDQVQPIRNPNRYLSHQIRHLTSHLWMCLNLRFRSNCLPSSSQHQECQVCSNIIWGLAGPLANPNLGRIEQEVLKAKLWLLTLDLISLPAICLCSLRRGSKVCCLRRSKPLDWEGLVLHLIALFTSFGKKVVLESVLSQLGFRRLVTKIDHSVKVESARSYRVHLAWVKCSKGGQVNSQVHELQRGECFQDS